MTDWGPVIIAFVTAAGGTLAAFAALWKAGREADKFGAEATATLVGGATDVVAILRQELADQADHQRRTDCRVDALETTVVAWDGWADRVLDILDRAVGMLSEDQRTALLPDVDHARETRPPRHSHAKHIIHRSSPKEEA